MNTCDTTVVREDDPPLLSAILDGTNGVLSQEEANKFFKVAEAFTLIEDSARTSKQKFWLNDYVMNVRRLCIEDRSPRPTDNAGRRGNCSTFVSPVREGPTPPPRSETVTKGRRKDYWDDTRWSDDVGPVAPIKLNELVVTPDKFDGEKSKAREWLEEFEAAAQANGWSDRVTLKYFPTFLIKEARQWFISFVQPSLVKGTEWFQVRYCFLRFYLGPDETGSARDDLKRARQQVGEPATKFIPRVMKLMRLANVEFSEREAVREIKNKLRDVYQDYLVGKKLVTLTELNDICLEVEARIGAPDRVTSQLKPAWKRTKPSNQVTRSSPPRKEQDAEKAKRVCTFCRKNGHTVDYCFAKKKDLKAKTERASQLSKSKAAPVAQESVEIGKEPKKPLITTLRNVCSVVAAANSKALGIFHPIKLNGVEFSAMIDTGSRVSIISAEVSKLLNLNPDGSAINLVGANQQPLDALGYAKIELILTIGPVRKITQTEFAVVTGLCTDVLLGYELLGWMGILVSPSSKAIMFESELKGVRVKERTPIKPRQQAIVDVTLPGAAEGKLVLAVPLVNASNLLMANSVDQVSNRSARCLLSNLGRATIELPKFMQIGTYEVLEPPDSDVDTVAATMQIGSREDTVVVGDQLSSEEKDSLRALIQAHSDAFSINGTLGDCRVIEHNIELEDDAKGVVEPLRRRPRAHCEEASRQVAKMLELGVIEPSDSDRAAAYVLVRKKDGSMRMCVDFRRLNEQTKKNLYPLPNLEDCIESLAGNNYYSQLDLASGYWQMRVAEGSRELTAFRTEEGVFHFRRLPFGLCNAPASFQRLMNALFGGLRGLQLQTFIDDLCLATKTWSEHLQLLKKVFLILIKSNLKLKPSKCIFGAERVVFLGHELSREGVRQAPEKLKAILELRDPKNVKEVQRFLGLFNYYRKFVPCFAKIAAPLYRLTRKDADFAWGDAEKKAAEELKSKMAENVVLAHYNEIDPICLKTDASYDGIAAILLQRQANEWRIVTCCSRSLSRTEENYAPTDLEGLAVVYAVTYLRNYLIGRHFVIYTDHCALCALKRKMPNSPRLRRWAMLLQEFDFDIKYVSGKLHADVDCLSRAPVDAVEDGFLDSKVLLVPESMVNPRDNVNLAVAIDTKAWAEETQTDAEGKLHLAKAKGRTKGYKILQGLLYFEDRLFVPKSRRKALLEASHCDAPACHGGMRATAERLSQYWWPQMCDEVREFVRQCGICQRRKAERAPAPGSMHSFVVLEPFELVAIDVLGPLPACITEERHVFVAIDCFSRFVYAEAAKDVQGVTAAEFMRKLIGVLGAPLEVLSDNAPTFCNTHVSGLLEQFCIGHRHSTPQHHEGNAQVERVIQSLQEKLALITHDPASTVDWKEALPSAVLSLNTTVHSATGFSAFELMFGKKHQTRTADVLEKRSPQAIYAALRDLTVERAHARAIANVDVRQCNSGRRFDERHRKITYEVDDEVLVRQAGRVTKLQNRFAGPYRVTQRANDIYTLERVVGSKKESLRRHVSDLKRAPNGKDKSSSASPPDAGIAEASPTAPIKKPMNAKILLVLAVLANQTKAQLQFVEAPLTTWRQTEANVSPRLTSLSLGIYFRSPCPVLRQFRAPELKEVELAVTQCENIFKTQITDKLATYTRIQAQQPQIMVPTRGNRISKRSLMDVLFGAIASNVVSTVVERIWPNGQVVELKTQVQLLDSRTAAMNSQLNFTALQMSALREGQLVLAKLVEHNVKTLDSIKSQYPQLAVVASDLVNRINLLSAFIDRAAASIRTGHPDLLTLFQIYQYESLLELDQLGIIPESCRIATFNGQILVVEMSGHLRSKDTAVYQVITFNHVGNIVDDDEEVLMEYLGPHYVVYNKTADCAQGVQAPAGRTVPAFCEVKNYVDPDLSSWRRVPFKGTVRSQMAQLYPVIYVYCYTKSITIDNITDICPPYAFKVSVNSHFNNSDISYRMDLARFQAGQSSNLIVHASSFHFKEDHSNIDKARAVHRVKELNAVVRDLERKQIAISSMGVTLTYKSWAISSASVALMSIAAAACLGVYVKVLRRKKKRVDEGTKETFTTFSQRRASESARELCEIYEVPRIQSRRLPLTPIAWRSSPRC